jgi:hypothetical protein
MVTLASLVEGDRFIKDEVEYTLCETANPYGGVYAEDNNGARIIFIIWTEVEPI